MRKVSSLCCQSFSKELEIVRHDLLFYLMIMWLSFLCIPFFSLHYLSFILPGLNQAKFCILNWIFIQNQRSVSCWWGSKCDIHPDHFAKWFRFSYSDGIILIVCMTCTFQCTSLSYYAFLQVAWEALSSVISSVPKEVLPSYMKLVRDAVSTSRDKERRKKKVKEYAFYDPFCVYASCWFTIFNSKSNIQTCREDQF